MGDLIGPISHLNGRLDPYTRMIRTIAPASVKPSPVSRWVCYLNDSPSFLFPKGFRTEES